MRQLSLDRHSLGVIHGMVVSDVMAVRLGGSRTHGMDGFTAVETRSGRDRFFSQALVDVE